MTNKAERLRAARIKAGYDTARAAADAMGIKPATYIHHENGTRDYKDAQAQQYARKFKVKPQWLLYGFAETAVISPIPCPILIEPEPRQQSISIRAVHMALAGIAASGIIHVDDVPRFVAAFTEVCQHIDRHNISDANEVRSLLRFAMRSNAAEKSAPALKNTD